MRVPPNPANEAIIEYLGLQWNREIEEQITTTYGPEVANQVKDLYEYALHRPHDWSRESLEEATARVAREIKEAYSFLTLPAAEKLAKCFWFVWLW